MFLLEVVVTVCIIIASLGRCVVGVAKQEQRAWNLGRTRFGIKYTFDLSTVRVK
jgi:hypothetical protein